MKSHAVKMEAYMESICQISLYGSFCVGTAWPTGVSVSLVIVVRCTVLCGPVSLEKSDTRAINTRKLVAFCSSPTKRKRDRWLINSFYSFFETLLGREHSGKVLKKFFGNIYFQGITLRIDSCLACVLSSYGSTRKVWTAWKKRKSC